MLKVYSCINKIKNFLDKLKDKEEIIAYKIVVDLNTSLAIKVVCENTNIIEKIKNFKCDVELFIDEIIEKNDFENDKYLQKYLDNSIDWSFKKRYDSFTFNKKIDIGIPIISFYSYKGGVGRTSTLVTFANYLSYHYGKNIVILDFDFEAPGVINFFDIDFTQNSKNGVIEFILDTQVSKNYDFNNYFIEVSKTFTGEGSIYIIPAGNISDLNNINSYIEGLSRIDINSAETIIEKIENLFKTVKKELCPDLILIDCRTGINDIFGLLVYSISSLIIGFFTNNKQNKPGIEIFLKYLLNEHAPDFILVNSQIHFESKFLSRFKKFKEEVYRIASNIKEDVDINFNYIDRIPLFTEFGTNEEDIEDYMDFIKNRISNTNYKNFYEAIIDYIDFDNIISNDLNPESKDNFENTKDIITIKKNLLETLNKNYPHPYADSDKIKFNESFWNEKFYFRKCMEDIFNYDKFLLIGSKGTGKTAFYRALNDENFLKHLKNKANKSQKKFKVVDIISLKEDRNKCKYFSIDNFDQTEINDSDFFYKRFWQIYILNSLVLENKRINNEFEFNFDGFILNEKDISGAKNFFEYYIYNDNKFAKIQQELNRLDAFLQNNDIYLLITFDQLDFIVKPTLWDKAIAPLINFCRSKPYSRILPKLFLRKDLYEKLSNITNKNSLDTKIINLEWNRDEIFGFFFKIIFAYSKKEFFQIMKYYSKLLRKYSYIKNGVMTAIQKYISKSNQYNQIPLENYYIFPLVDVFFGKYVYSVKRVKIGTAYDYPGKYVCLEERFGTVYDWLYKNLQNANGTISLRPFLDLIRFAIDKYLKSEEIDKVINPILPPNFYTHKDARKKAVERHFEDLANEEGNEDFKKIINYIKDTASGFPQKFRKRILKGLLYEEFLEHLLNNIELSAKTKNEIEKILTVNGVIKVDFISGNEKQAEFAFLYKYFLGLKG